MSNNTTPQSKSELIDASHIVDSFMLRTGVSAKTGADYVIGQLKIKTKRGRPFTLNLAYLDDNSINAIEDSLEHYIKEQAGQEQAKQDFQQGFDKEEVSKTTTPLSRQ